jgi:glycosyltransferase involved in cell wall biosynthesis
MSQRPSIILLMRKESPCFYSIERLFESLLPSLSGQFAVRIMHLPCHSRGFWRRIWNLAFTACLRADVIHVTGDVYYCALAVPRRKCVLTIHDLSLLDRLKGPRRVVFKIIWYSMPLRWAPRITAISKETKSRLESNFPAARGKIELVPNCVDPVFRSNTHFHRAANAKPQLLQIGTGENKNLERVAVAASSLPLHLRIIGTLSTRQCSFLDSIGLDWSSTENLSNDELIREYRNSDALVFVSTHEGFGLPILEAQQVGIPVVTSNLAPMSDTAGGAALLVNPYDECQIRTALEELLQGDGLAHRLSERGRRNVERFDVKRVARKYADVYAVVLGR